MALRDASSSAGRAYAPDAAQWVVGADGTGVVKGRMKFCRPAFRAVGGVDRGLAVETYEANREAFHPIAQTLIEKVRRVFEAGRCLVDFFFFVMLGFGDIFGDKQVVDGLWKGISNNQSTTSNVTIYIGFPKKKKKNPIIVLIVARVSSYTTPHIQHAHAPYLKSPHKSPNMSSFFDTAGCAANNPLLPFVHAALPPQMSVVFIALAWVPPKLLVLAVAAAGAPQMLADGVVLGRVPFHPEETPH